MQRQALLVCFVSFILFCLSQQAYGCIDTLRNERGDLIVRQWPQEAGEDYQKDVVVFETKPEALMLPEGKTEASLEECQVEQELLGALLDANTYYIRKVFPDAMAGDTIRILDDSVFARVPDLSNIFKGLLQGGSDVYYAVNSLCGLQDIVWAEPNIIMQPLAVPNDNLYPEQWNLKDFDFGIGCETAWDVTKGNPQVRIGVVGSGIDASHPDMALKVVGGHNYHDPPPPGDPWGDDGRNFGHETNVAGIIAARTNNQIGIAGIAGGWNSGQNDIGAVLYSLRGTDNNGIMEATDMAWAIYGGVDHFQCNVINISWGKWYSSALHRAVTWAQSHRCTIVAAVGNTLFGPERPNYPSDYEDSWVVAIGAYGPDGIYCRAGINCLFDSEFGYPLDVLAPGVSVKTTGLNSGYVDFGGTSAAAPHGAGTIALVLSRIPRLRSEAVNWIINHSAVEAGQGGYDDLYGWGRISAKTIFQTYLNPGLSRGRMNDYAEYYWYSEINEVDYDWHWAFYDEPQLPSTYYEAYCHQVTFDITYPDEYSFFTGVWGKRQVDLGYGPWETDGWSPAEPNMTVGYCEVIPGTESRTGCQLKTYFYFVNIGNDVWEWFPFDPYNNYVLLCYTVWGIKAVGDPNRPGEGKLADFRDTSLTICYPNPSNNGVYITLELKNGVEVDVDIFDIEGRKIADVFKGFECAGTHILTWSGVDNRGKQVPSGLYFYKITGLSTQKTGRFLIIK